MKKRIRLLIVTDDANMGGTYKVAERLALGLHDFFETEFACLFNSGNEASRATIASAGVNVVDYPVTESQLHRSTFATDEAEDLLEAADPELILLVDGGEIWSHLALKNVARARDIPYIMIVNLLCRDCPERFTDLRERALDALQAAHSVIFVSEAIKRRFEELFVGIEAKTFIAIPNGCPSYFFTPVNADRRDSVRRSLNIPEDATMFLTTARLEPRKGQLLCLRALKEMKARRDISKIRLVLAGVLTEGSYQRLFEAYVEEAERHGLLENITILGPRDDVPDLLDACDAFILASSAEGGLPLSIMEAMAKGRPVITTAIDEISAMLDDASAILVPSPNVSEPQCVDALAAAMLRLHDEPQSRRELGRQASLRAERMFHQSRMISAYKDALLSAPVERSPGYLLGSGNKKSLRSGDVINFSVPEQMYKYTKDGWSHPEDDGVWTDGTQSTIRLRCSHSAMEDVKLLLELTPFVPSGHRQTTDVFVDGGKIDTWYFDAYRRETRSIVLPRNAILSRGARTVEIRLVHKSPACARDFGIGDDARQLAIKLHYLEFATRSLWLSSLLRVVLSPRRELSRAKQQIR